MIWNDLFISFVLGTSASPVPVQPRLHKTASLPAVAGLSCHTPPPPSSSSHAPKIIKRQMSTPSSSHSPHSAAKASDKQFIPITSDFQDSFSSLSVTKSLSPSVSRRHSLAAVTAAANAAAAAAQPRRSITPKRMRGEMSRDGDADSPSMKDKYKKRRKGTVAFN